MATNQTGHAIHLLRATLATLFLGTAVLLSACGTTQAQTAGTGFVVGGPGISSYKTAERSLCRESGPRIGALGDPDNPCWSRSFPAANLPDDLSADQNKRGPH